MSARFDPVRRDEDGESLRLPSLVDAHGAALEGLRRHGGLGLVSVSVLQSFAAERATDWRRFDEILRRIGEFLRGSGNRALRRSDRILEPSLSGNTFVLLLEPPRDGRRLSMADLGRVRHRLRTELGTHLRRTTSSGSLTTFGIYVGASVAHFDEGVGVDRVLARALDEAVADALRDKDREGGRRARHLHRIIEKGLVRAVFQPVVDLHERTVVGYEALTRVGKSRFENVEAMFRAAESLDLLFGLERLCRRRAIRNAPPLRPDQMLFLNVEPESCNDPDFTGPEFSRAIRDSGLVPSQVVIELTEHSRIRDFSRFAAALEGFRTLGFRIAVDDVGSAYSGLHVVAEIAPDFLKIDMGLVRRIHAHPIKREIVRTIVQLSRNTGMRVIAEGVEAPDEVEALLALGVRCAQGYLFARPSHPVDPPVFPRVKGRT